MEGCTAGAGQDPVAALLYCTSSIGSVDLSVINGHIVVKDGQLMTIDLQVGGQLHVFLLEPEYNRKQQVSTHA